MIRLAISLTEQEAADACRRAARRLREVALADGVANCDAVITDDLGVASRAVDAARHVLLEGAARSDGSRLAELAEACRRASRCLMPAHAWRFQPSVRAVRDALDAGKLGEPGLLRIHRWKSRDDARSEPAELVPELDLANWFFGSRPREIYAVSGAGYFQVHLGFPDGGMALIDRAVLPAGTGYDSLSLIGSTGAAYADDHRNLHLLYAGDHASAVGKVEGSLHVVSQLEEFTGAIRAGRSPSVTADETIAALDVLDAVTAAARERRVARSTPGGSYELEA